ncbi:MAG: transporter substrate-binding domain-containing protein [Campylobacterota bacterium]|nr:transporter substrate-binding domain-containing protein [Campylobacterota bacterium]
MNLSPFQIYRSLFVFLLFFYASNLSSLTFTPEEKKWIQENPKVTLGADYSWPPYDFADKKGHHSGISADFLSLISQKSGLVFDVKTDVWSKVMEDMKAGKLDGLSCAVETDERKKFLNFTTPYVSMPLALIVQNKNNTLHSIDDLKDKTVAINKDSYLHEWLTRYYPEIKLHLTTSNHASLEAVSFSHADAFIGNIAVATYIMKERFLSNLKIVNKIPDMQTEVSIAIDKNNPLLFTILEKTLESISRAEREKIIKKWFDISKDKSASTVLLSAEENLLKLTAEEKKWIQENPVVTYSEVNWKPLSIIQDNTMVGMLNDYLKLITAQTGITFSYKPSTSWPNVLENFKEGKIDMVPGIGDNAYESSLGLTSDTFVKFPFVLVTRNEEAFIDSLDEFENSDKAIAIPKQWTSYNYLVENRPNIKIIETKDVFEALELVDSGKAYAFLGHLAVAMHYVGIYYSNKLHIAGKIDFKFHHKILLHKKDSVLLNIINKALANISEKEHLDINNKWLHVEVKAAKDFSFLWKYALLILFIFLLFAFWNRKMAHEIKARKRIEEALHVEKENFKVLFEKVSNGNLILQNGIFITCNTAALTMLGLKDKEQLLRSTPDHWSPLLQPDGQASDEKAQQMIQQCLKQGDKRFEWVHKDINDKEFWVDVTLTKISYEGDTAVYVIWHDISQQKELQNRLQINQDKMVMTSKAANMGLWDLHPKSGELYVNDVWSSMLGYKLDDLISLSNTDSDSYIFKKLQEGFYLWNKLIHPNDFIRFSEEMQRHFDGKTELYRIEYRMQNAAGEWVWILDVGQVYERDEEGTSLRMNGIHIDISEQKFLENSLQSSQRQTELLIDNIPLHIIVTNHEGNILRANPQAFQDYQIEKKDLAQYNILDFYADRSDRDMILETLHKEGRVNQKILNFKRQDNTHISVMLSVIPIVYDSQNALLSIAIDMSQRLEMEQALTDAKESAEAANRSKSEFLANMSHEIRTPMNAIIGFTELLNEQLSEPRLQSYVKTIQSAGNTLLTLINDILDLSKIEAGKMQLQKRPTNVHNLFEEIGSIFSMSMRNKGLDLVIDVEESIPQSLFLDDIRLRQILFNLIGNAVKFTQHGFVKLQLRALNVDEHHSKLDLAITVQDTGVGIPQDQLQKIFEVFEQREGQDNRQFGGTGLGLSISTRLAEMMHGRISVESVQNQGTTFKVEIQGIDISSILTQRHTDNKLAFDAKRIIFKPAKILVVDDIKDNRDLIIKNFDQSDIEIQSAENGQIAVDKVNSETFDLIIMDIRMPVIDGYEAARIIKQHHKEIPIIALTASVMNSEFEELKRDNFDGYLRKPVLRNDLFNEISRFLKYDTITKKRDEDHDIELSSKATQNISTILDILSHDVTPLHERVSANNNISEIKEFASKIRDLALKYDIAPLDRYASQIFKAVDSFDIALMQELLKQYPQLEKTLADT